ncbi:hypothetical protein [Kitasatospora purpeofusca]|uniref:hypothetical protein n=1 Tax=Kitasatospora purpeofusca TaxID=67352 RepID=UPI002A5A076E|nr:hypothetical protein [Kitasatospora purpeofusca]MDY0816311.1 hypothetical protein [Kitasatospora purpeofusca]
MAGFGVDPQVLKLAEEGINAAITELQGLGITGLAESGRGFSELELSGVEAGHPDLHAVFTGFCERWSWGVRSLVQEGSELALKLGLSAGFYHEQERYAHGLLKGVVTAGIGDLHQTEEQVEGKSWDQIWGDNQYSQLTNPDFSPQSAEKALDGIGKTWKDIAKEKLEGPFGINKAIAEGSAGRH